VKPVVVLSILEPTVEATASRMAEAPGGCGLIEIRADHLRAEDLPGLIAGAPGEVLVTVRPVAEGGGFDGSEDERRRRIVAALDAGARLVDVEHGSALADLAMGDAADRVVLSHHDAPCRYDALEPIYREMTTTRAARLKIVPRAKRPGEADAVRRLLRLASGEDRPLACFAMGEAGAATRVLAPSWGSWATYGAAVRGRETAAGQITAEDLLGLYRALDIGSATRRFALVGRPVSMSPSPAMHQAAYREYGIDASYLPVDAADLDRDVVPLVGPDGALGLEGLAVTIPLKEQAAGRAEPGDAVVSRAGAANTVIISDGRWTAYNTDGPAALALVGAHVALEGARVAVAGAGGTARALAAVMAEAGAEVTVYNRTGERSRALAAEIDVGASDWESLRESRWDVLVQTTPLGKNGEEVIPSTALVGRVVLDAVYGNEPTPLIREARSRGLVAIDGFDLLVAQAVLQFHRMTGIRPDAQILRDAGARWLSAASCA
jgi:3-dehydroquinate dehydratase/shikimate dehydrogenase